MTFLDLTFRLGRPVIAQVHTMDEMSMMRWK